VAFTGAWRLNATYQPDERTVHVADPAHAMVGPDESVQALNYATPPQLDPGPVGEFPGMEYVVETTGRVIDTSDTRSHVADPGDHGAAVEGVYAEPMTRFADERYITERFEGNTAPEVNPVALQRGRNGLAVNNPNGFRLGWVERYFENRKFPVGERVHDHRIIFPDLPSFDEGAAPVEAGPYPVPFNSLARNITNVNQRPQARREPPPLYGDAITDGAPFYSALGDWIGVAG
jgi:hypothetical protein